MQEKERVRLKGTQLWGTVTYPMPLARCAYVKWDNGRSYIASVDRLEKEVG